MLKEKLRSLRLASVQLVCALVVVVEFIFDIIDKKFAIFTWKAHEYLEYIEVFSVMVLILVTILVMREKADLVENERKRNRVLTLDISVLINEIFYEFKLTKTEREIAWLNIKGYSNAEIAELRDSTESTVKKHQSSIFSKFGVSNRNNFLSEILDRIIDGKL